MNVELPIDLLQLPSFRQLRGALPGGKRSDAVYVMFVLNQELNYRLQNGETPGRLNDAALASLQETLAPDYPDFAVVKKALVEGSKILVPDGAEFICPSYEAPARSTRNMAREGGFARAYIKRVERASEEATRVGLLIADRFVDAEGKPMDGERVKRINMVIYAADAALGLEERQPYAYGEALIKNADAILNNFTNDQIEQGMKQINRKRDNPMLRGVSPEKLLADFGAFVEKLK